VCVSVNIHLHLLRERIHVRILLIIVTIESQEKFKHGLNGIVLILEIILELLISIEKVINSFKLG